MALVLLRCPHLMALVLLRGQVSVPAISTLHTETTQPPRSSSAEALDLYAVYHCQRPFEAGQCSGCMHERTTGEG